MLARLFLILAMLGGTAALAAPQVFDRDMAIPPVVEDQARPAQCTIAFLVMDVATNDIFASRMRITPQPGARPQGNRMPCPEAVPARMATRAMDACTTRVDDPNKCVFADMSRGFELQPVERNTASNASRCSSDRANYVGLACWRTPEGLDVCNVACGAEEAAALSQARARCEDKHGRVCAITGAVPVLAP